MGKNCEHKGVFTANTKKEKGKGEKIMKQRVVWSYCIWMIYIYIYILDEIVL